MTDSSNASLLQFRTPAVFESVLAYTSDLIAMFETLDGPVYRSPAFGCLLGYTEQEMAERQIFSFSHQDDRHIAVDALMSTPAGTKSAPFRFRMTCKDGTPLLVEMVAHNMLDDEVIRAWLVVGHDVTGAVAAADGRSAAEADLAVVLSEIQQAMFRTDSTGRLVYLSPAFEQIMGVPVAEAIGESPLIFMSEAERTSTVTAMADAIDARSPNVKFVWNVRRPDKSRVVVAAAVEIRYDNDGGVLGMLGVVDDVTAQHESAEAAALVSQRFAALVSHTTEIITVHDTHTGGVVQQYGAIGALLGARTTAIVVHPSDRESLLAAIRTPCGSSVEYRALHDDGTWRWFDARVADLRNHPAVGGIVVTSREASSRKEAAARLQWAATHDTLTRLCNRAWLHTEITDILQRDGVPALVFIDLDRFKSINDALGHDVGDQVLVMVAARLTEVADGNAVVRLGGDEFVIVVDTRSRIGAEPSVIANRVRDILALPLVIDGRVLSVSGSVGLKVAEPGEGHEELLRHADLAMYQAKRGGRDRVCHWDPSLAADVAERFNMELELRAMLAHNPEQLVAFLQPCIDLASGDIKVVEALIRWRHPLRGLLAPDKFLRLASSAGMGLVFGERAIEAAFEAHAVLSAAQPGVALAVNATCEQVLEPGFAQWFLDTAARWGVAPCDLRLEVLEEFFNEHDPQILATLVALRDRGVLVAIDDFGTGYSSITRLRTLPVDVLKVDQALVAGFAADPDGTQAVLNAVAALGRGLGKRVTVEGVETAAQLTLVRSSGIHAVQGFLLSPPLPADELAARFRTLALPWGPPSAG